jgi:SNF2 family DNA or RNA helicase
MQVAARTPAPGQVVRVRQRRYLVEDVTPPPSAADATLVRLSCLDDDAQGQELEVLWEAEPDGELLTGAGWERLASRGFDPPRLFSAYLHTMRWNCVTATNPRLFQAPYRAGIHIDAYQIEPLRKALLLPRVNLFIADDVGLGKTIEAGLIARELLLRKKVRDIVVACPPSVLPQWQDEMGQRFGLSFEVLDKDYVVHIRRERGYGTNPWATHTRFLISHRLLIDEAYAGPLRDWLGDFRAGSLLILDEAHHAAPSAGSRYAIDSKITRAIRGLAPRFEHRLFLSATPHNGHSNSFSALLEILDPQRFCRGVPVRGKSLLEDVMVRRLKEDLREVQGGFPRRVVKQIDIDGLPDDAPELRLSVLLDQYRRLREDRLSGETKKKQAAAALLVSGLQQRLLSSVEAFARTLRVHRRTVERQRQKEQDAARPAAQPELFDLLGAGIDSDDDRAELDPEDLGREEEAQFEAASAASSAGTQDDEVRLLDEMTRIAEHARGLPDARVVRLVGWIRENLCPGLPEPGGPVPAGDPPAWGDRRVLVFTEYEDTLRYLRQQLEAAIQGTDRAEGRIEVYHGPTPQPRREEIKRAFNADPHKHPLRILLATDAAREGINLQTHCADLFHFNVPWNPARLEQRNGRIARKLQPRPEVNCHYFVYRQRAEDRVLHALVRKTDRIKRELGSLAQVVEGRLAETLSTGIRHADVGRLEQVIDSDDLAPEVKDTVGEELEAARERQDELRGRKGKLQDLLKTSRDWVGLEPDHFRAALSCALELAGAETLKPEADSSGRFVFPALDRREGGDASLGRQPRRAAGAPREGAGLLGVAARLAGPPGGVRGPRHDDRRGGPPAPGAPGRAAAAGAVPGPGVRLRGPVPGLPGPDGRPDPAGCPPRPALPVRRRGGPAARGADPRHRPLGGPGQAQGRPQALRHRRREGHPPAARRLPARPRPAGGRGRPAATPGRGAGGRGRTAPPPEPAEPGGRRGGGPASQGARRAGGPGDAADPRKAEEAHRGRRGRAPGPHPGASRQGGGEAVGGRPAALGAEAGGPGAGVADGAGPHPRRLRRQGPARRAGRVGLPLARHQLSEGRQFTRHVYQEKVVGLTCWRGVIDSDERCFPRNRSGRPGTHRR